MVSGDLRSLPGSKPTAKCLLTPAGHTLAWADGLCGSVLSSGFTGIKSDAREPSIMGIPEVPLRELCLQMLLASWMIKCFRLHPPKRLGKDCQRWPSTAGRQMLREAGGLDQNPHAGQCRLIMGER